MASIEEMLDAVAAKQIRCPECNECNEIVVGYPDYYWHEAAMTMDGSMLVFEESEPSEPATEWMPPSLLCCNNISGHDTGQVHYWELPKDVPTAWVYRYEEIVEARGTT